MNESERQFEIHRLKTTLTAINQQLANSAASFRHSQQALQVTLSNYWESTGRNKFDEAQAIADLTRQRTVTAHNNRRHQQLLRLLASPYFGRIDFIENGWSTTPEQIYIGITSLSDSSTGEILIYDWRTPVAGMFYDFERGQAAYQCPAGTVSGLITLKRQYKISDGQMKYMFDSDLKIDDELLQEMLSKSADTKMHSIVTTIQREQNQVIRNTGHRLLFVQGPAGSGKTSIALHRIAYLLYRDRDMINASNVLILSPNHIFSDYIGNVLPELGEEGVLQLTYSDYVARCQADLTITLEGRTDQLEYLLSSRKPAELAIRRANINYKSSTAFTAVIQKFLDFLDHDLLADYPDITFRNQVVFGRQDWVNYNHSLAFLPIVRRLAKIHHLMLIKLRPLVHQVREEHAAAITAAGEEINAKTIKALARIAAGKELAPLMDQIGRLTTLQPLALYSRLFSDTDLFERFAADTAVPAEWPAIRQQTQQLLRSGQIPYEDSLAFIYFQGSVNGFPANPAIKHVVIDEAQDYTALQYKTLGSLFPNCSWTILGDPAQTVHPYLQTVDFATASDILSVENPAIVRLTRSYRSTQEIQAFCQALLPGTAKVELVNRSGTLPEVMCVSGQDSLAAVLVEKVKQLTAANRQTIAIIGKTARDCATIHDQLADRIKLTLITTDDDQFHRGVVVIPAYLAKGLEFDAVLVVDADAQHYHDQADMHLLYTACTRALHQLSLLNAAALTPLVAAINPELYTVCSHP